MTSCCCNYRKALELGEEEKPLIVDGQGGADELGAQVGFAAQPTRINDHKS